MLKFPATIKNSARLFCALLLCSTLLSHSPESSANTKTLQHFYQRTTTKQQPEDGFAFRAVARLTSPDGKTELSTRADQVSLSSGKRFTLKGTNISVQLEGLENHFKKTYLVKIRADSRQSELNAGMFRLTAFNEHSFLYTDKKSGWTLEVRLQPLHPLKALEPYINRGKRKSPAKYSKKKSKRVPV
jgi:hypothetical protein